MHMLLGNDKVSLFIKAYESGGNDLRSLNRWLKADGLKLIAKNVKIINVVAA